MTHRKPTAAFWVVVAVVTLLLIAYPFAYGPWLFANIEYRIPEVLKRSGDCVFHPMYSLMLYGPDYFQRTLGYYTSWWWVAADDPTVHGLIDQFPYSSQHGTPFAGFGI